MYIYLKYIFMYLDVWNLNNKKNLLYCFFNEIYWILCFDGYIIYWIVIIKEESKVVFNFYKIKVYWIFMYYVSIKLCIMILYLSIKILNYYILLKG